MLRTALVPVAALLLAGCGAAATGTGTPAPAPTQGATGSSPTAAPASVTSSPTPAVTAGQLTAVAQQVYTPSGQTCQQGPSTYAQCPFTDSLRQRLETATQNQQGPGANLLCHCQNPPPSYAVTGATATASGGTATVTGDYGSGDTLTFSLAIISVSGQLLVDDIRVQPSNCSQPVEIDSTSGC